MNCLIKYALSFVGTPYGWGKEGPSQFDCSGFVQELLRSVGLDPPGDQTAQTLYDHFESKGSQNSYGPGALAFYGESVRKLTHVAMLIDSYRIVEAAGGDSTTLTPEDAEKKKAFVRIRLLWHRADLVSVIRPRYTTIGVI